MLYLTDYVCTFYLIYYNMMILYLKVHLYIIHLYIPVNKCGYNINVGVVCI